LSKPEVSKELRVAYHEAGHAVVACILGRTPKRVTIEGDDHVLGRCETWSRPALLANLEGVVSDASEDQVFGNRTERPPRERGEAWLQLEVQKEIQVLLAGGIATERLDRQNGYEDPNVGDEGDVAIAFRIAGQLADRFAVASSDEQTEAFIKYLAVRAKDLLNARWPAVEAVAAALIERKTLTRKELAEILFSATLGGHEAGSFIAVGAGPGQPAYCTGLTHSAESFLGELTSAETS
jgi:hypothetical protein